MTAVLFLGIGAYLLGSIPFGLLIVRAATGRDIRQEGSGNIGASNVYRVAGPGLALAVLALDLVKGVLPMLVAHRVSPHPLPALAVGIAAVAGHNWSIFLRGQGGKGIATSYGVLLGLSPASAVVAGIVWVIVALLTRYASLASLVGVLSVPFAMWIRHEPVEHLAFGVAAVVFAFYRHRANIGRLRRGEELKISRGGTPG